MIKSTFCRSRFLLALCTFFGIFFTTQQAKASHMMGASIEYKYLGNNRYLIIAKIYRDCRGITFNSPTFRWFAGTNGGSSCGNGSLGGFPRRSITSVSNVCPYGTKPCSTMNSPSSEGVEEHIYSDTIDVSKSPYASALSSSSCPDLTIAVGQCCRPGTITTGPGGNDFWAVCVISVGNLRKCMNEGNNSLTFRAPPLGFVCCLTPIYYNTQAIDTSDRDSISYHIASGLSSLPKTSVTYSSPFSYDFPVTPYCVPPTTIKCTPNISVDPPRGFYMDSKTGDVIFTPTKCDEVPVIVIEAREYRKDTTGKYLLVGIVRRDMLYYVKDDCNPNKSPRISGTFVLTVNAGDTICTDFTIEDNLFTPYQTVPDTLKVSGNGESPDPTFTSLSDTFPNKETVTFCWATKKSDGNTNPWHFYINANDQFCNRPSTSSRGILVYVKPQDSSWMSITSAKCNQFTLKGSIFQSKTSGTKFDWKILDSATGQVVSTITNNNNFLTPVLPKGSYKITMIASNGIYFYEEIFQYLHVQTNAVKVELGNYRATCFGTSHTFKALDSFAKAPLKFAWTMNGAADTAKSNMCTVKDIKTAKLAKVTLTDADGCVATDTVTCGVYVQPAVAWTKIPLNSICHSNKDLELTQFIKYPDSATRASGQFRIWGKNKKYSTTGIVDSVDVDEYYFRTSKINNEHLGNGSYYLDSLVLLFRDSQGCVNISTTTIRVNGTPVIQLESGLFCVQRGGAYQLDSLVIRPKTQFGTIRAWQAISAPSGVNTSSLIGKDASGNDTFSLGNAGDNSRIGNYQVTLKVTDQVTACAAEDTTNISIIGIPVIQKVTLPGVCQYSRNLDLTELFQLNGTNIDANYSTFTIKAYNGDTNSNAWSGVTLISGRFLPSSSAHGIWTIECTNNQSGCSAKEENTFQMYAKPQADFATSPASNAPVSAPFFSTTNKTTIASSDNLTYFWNFDFPNTGNTSTAFQPSITYPANNDEYVVQMRATSSRGCHDTAVKILSVGNAGSLSDPDLIGFKINSFFQVSGVVFQSIQIQVFDATGKLVSQTKNNEKIVLPAGVYYYQVQFSTQNGAKQFQLRGKVPVSGH